MGMIISWVVHAFPDVVNGLADDNHAGFCVLHVPEAHRQRRQSDSLLCLHMQLGQDQTGVLLSGVLGLTSAQRPTSQRLLRRRNRSVEPVAAFRRQVTRPERFESKMVHSCSHFLLS